MGKTNFLFEEFWYLILKSIELEYRGSAGVTPSLPCKHS